MEVKLNGYKSGFENKVDMIHTTWAPDKSCLFICISFKQRGFDINSSSSGDTDDGIPYKGVAFSFYDQDGKELDGMLEVCFIGLDGGRFYYSHNKRDMDIVYIPYTTTEKVYNDANLVLNSKDYHYGTES